MDRPRHSVIPGPVTNVKVVTTVEQLKKFGLNLLRPCFVNLVRWVPPTPQPQVQEAPAIIPRGTSRQRFRPYRSNKCPRKFSKRQTLSAHINRIHNNPNRLRCSICGRKYDVYPSLRSHQRTHLIFTREGNRIHPEERPYRCSVCGKRWTTVTNLYAHTRSRPQCKFGGNAYRRKNFRPLPKPFSCPMCPRSFILQDDLTYHVRFHKDESVVNALKKETQQDQQV